MQNQVMTMDQATALVQRINHRKVASPLSSMEIHVERLDNSIALKARLDGTDVPMSSDAERSILRVLGVSRKFLDNASEDPSLLEQAIQQSKIGAARKDNVLVEASMSGAGEVDMFSLIQGKKIPTSLNLSDVWRTVAGMDVFSGVSEIAHVGKGHYEMRCLTPHTAAPTRNVGDIVSTGLRISVNGSVKVNPYNFRLVCANGMQRAEEGDVFNVNMDDPHENLREAIHKCLRVSQGVTQSFVDTDNVIVPNPAEYVMRAVKIAGGGNNLRSTVVDMLAEQAPDSSLYQILNIVTALGRQQTDNPRARNKTEQVAGRIVAMQAGSSRCTTCNSAVSSNV